MRTSTVFVMLLLVVAASAEEEKPQGNATVSANTQAPEQKPGSTQSSVRKPIDEEEERRETENRDGERGIDGTAPKESAVNEGGNAVDGQSAESSEEATSMTSGGMTVGGLAAVAATLTYLF